MTRAISKTTKTVAKKPNAKESKPADKKLSQMEAAIQILGKSKDPMNCIAMVESMEVQGL